jgi:hypothetical protein
MSVGLAAQVILDRAQRHYHPLVVILDRAQRVSRISVFIFRSR